MSPRLALPLVGCLALTWSTPAAAQDDGGLLSWSKIAARGAFELCKSDAPDATAVAEHGEIWGWPRFVPYLEHPDGYKRDAGGQSRRTDEVGDTSAYVEVSVQSGAVTAAAPADVTYFRCDVAADQPINGELEAYFTANYGAPASKTDAATVWLTGAAAGAAPGDEDAAFKAVAAAGPGAQGTRIELTRERGLDRAKLTAFRCAAAQ